MIKHRHLEGQISIHILIIFINLARHFHLHHPLFPRALCKHSLNTPVRMLKRHRLNLDLWSIFQDVPKTIAVDIISNVRFSSTFPFQISLKLKQFDRKNDKMTNPNLKAGSFRIRNSLIFCRQSCT